jgi:hypothetical protein
MKWNWGTGVFIFILLFLGACVAFLLYAQRQKWNMVEDDYYAKELRHEEKLDKMRNANALTTPLVASLGKSDMVLQFPVELKGKKLSGTIHIYRPSDQDLDVILPVSADTALAQSIPLKRFRNGRYVVKVEWDSGEKSYYKELDIFIP